MKRTSKKNINRTKEVKGLKTDIKPQEKTFWQKYLKYIFLILLFFYFTAHFYEQINGNKIYENLGLYLLFPSIFIGIISLYFDKKNLNKIVNNLFSPKETQNLLSKIKTFFSKKERVSTILFFIVLGISVYTLFNKLDNFDIFSDEVQVTKGAAGYYYTGEYRQWDFIKESLVGKPYTVAKPHQWLVAQSYKIFGVNTFAARFPSAFFGILLIAFLYLLGKYFIKDKYAALLSAFSFALYFEFLFLGRWARMYGILYPISFLVFYWTFKFINENNNLSFLNFNNKFINKYLNFNYVYIPFIIILLYIGINTHTNITVFFLIFLIYLLLCSVIFRTEKKYLTAFLFAFSIFILQIIFHVKVNFKNFTFFEIDNSPVYNAAFFGYPFSLKITTIILITGFSTLFLIKNNNFIKKYLLLFITVFIPWVFFSYIISFPPNYRYVSFLTPFAIMLIAGSFMLLSKSMYGKTIQYILAGLFLTSSILSYSNHYKSLYEKNKFSPSKPSIAQKVIIKNIKEGDVIFKHWGPKLYMKGIPKSTKFYKLGSYKGKDIQTLYKMMSEHQSGWLIWDKSFEGRLDPDFVSYCNLYFKKYAGYGIDNYGEEIYYYDKSMLMPLELLQYQKYMPAANLNLKNSFSFVFDIKIDKNTEGDIFYFNSDTTNVFKCYLKNKIFTAEINKNKNLSSPLQENILNRIILQISPEKTDIFVNGEKKISGKLKFNSEIVKFNINPQFNAYFNNIRLYDFILNKAQIIAIERDKTVSEELSAKGEIFRTMFLWKKK